MHWYLQWTVHIKVNHSNTFVKPVTCGVKRASANVKKSSFVWDNGSVNVFEMLKFDPSMSRCRRKDLSNCISVKKCSKYSFLQWPTNKDPQERFCTEFCFSSNTEHKYHIAYALLMLLFNQTWKKMTHFQHHTMIL